MSNANPYAKGLAHLVRAVGFALFSQDQNGEETHEDGGGDSGPEAGFAGVRRKRRRRKTTTKAACCTARAVSPGVRPSGDD